MVSNRLAFKEKLMKSDGQQILGVMKRSLFFLILLATTVASQAQTLAQHNWYFGNSINAIRFNRATNKALPLLTKPSPLAQVEVP